MPYSLLEDKTKEKSTSYHHFTKEEWKSYPFASKDEMQWFRDAKIGMFFHVGISALGKVDIGWSRQTHKLPDPGVGIIPDEIYDGWAEQIALKDFCAKDWIKLVKDGGMNYVVIIAKHHDGFHLWDSKYSDYKITKAPFGRDYIKELVDECHAQNIKIGIYFSQRDWKHEDYEPVDPKKSHALPNAPFHELNEGESFEITDKHKKFIKYMHNVILELMTNYGKIDIFWWDAHYFNGMFLEEMWETNKIEREVRHLQPGIIINNRGSVPGDFDTPEGRVGMFQNHRPWETCMPLGPAWAWTGEKIKSFETVMHQFINCLCGDGNYLLSIGAMENGVFDKPEQERIRQIGAWLSKYGEAVYKTRGGPWMPENFGGSTHKENIAYLHILQYEKRIFLPKLNNKLIHAEALTGEKVEISENDTDYVITLIKDDIENVDIIVKLTFESIITEIKKSSIKNSNKFSANEIEYGKLIQDTKMRNFSDTITIDLELDMYYTGLYAENNIDIEISVLTDDLKWEKIYQGTDNTIEFTRLDAGAIIIGRKIKGVKINSDTEFCLDSIKIYGKTE